MVASSLYCCLPKTLKFCNLALVSCRLYDSTLRLNVDRGLARWLAYSPGD
ncbi:unnamed protein product [Rhodiola kirilowii]